MADRIDPAVHAVEPTVPEPARDCMVGDAQITQLVNVEDPVLASREISHRPPRTGVWADFPAI